jgi:hypothetical protein
MRAHTRAGQPERSGKENRLFDGTMGITSPQQISGFRGIEMREDNPQFLEKNHREYYGKTCEIDGHRATIE